MGRKQEKEKNTWKMGKRYIPSKEKGGTVLPH